MFTIFAILVYSILSLVGQAGEPMIDSGVRTGVGELSTGGGSNILLPDGTKFRLPDGTNFRLPDGTN